MYTLIPTVYQALLKSAVSGIGLRIHTTKKKHGRDTKFCLSFLYIFPLSFLKVTPHRCLVHQVCTQTKHHALSYVRDVPQVAAEAADQEDSASQSILSSQQARVV